MSQAKASLSPHLVPPRLDIERPRTHPRVTIGSAYSPGAVVRRPEQGIYYETMPRDLGRDGDVVQALLLTGHKPRQLSVMPLLRDWYVRVVEWFTRMWRTALAMMGVTR